MLIVDLEGMPDKPFDKDDLRKSQNNWYNNVRYEIRLGDEILDSAQDVCYSGITRSVVDIFQNKSEPERRRMRSYGYVRYFCKNGDNVRRTDFIVYLLKFFNPLYKKIHIYWSPKHNEIIVDCYWKSTTPLDSVYAVGSFIRLSWEQWYLHDFKETDHFKILMQTLESTYVGHIPTLFFTTHDRNDFKKSKLGPEVPKIALEILLPLIQGKKVYKRPFNSIDWNEDVDTYHKIQVTAYNAVVSSEEFKSHGFVEQPRGDEVEW